jgi:hypothetical protein
MLSIKSIEGLAKLACGGPGVGPYRTGYELTQLFNRVLPRQDQSVGGSSRWFYAESRIREINDLKQLNMLIRELLDARTYLGTDYALDSAVDFVNQCLIFEDLQARKAGRFYQLVNLADDLLSVSNPRIFGSEQSAAQLAKCRAKIETEDYDGAITNARALLESVLIDVLRNLGEETNSFDGDLPKLFKRVQSKLNLDPGRKEISEVLKQILSGLTSIVNGLSSLRNKMGDAHATTYRPDRHHAKLAVNAAQMLVEFIQESANFQVGRRKVRD